MKTTGRMNPAQSNGWGEALRAGNAKPNGRDQVEVRESEPLPAKGKLHACQASQRFLQQAGDRLNRANRDLGETAAFVAAALTTITAIEAVINIAIDRIGMSTEILQAAFKFLAVAFACILFSGILRAQRAMKKRAQAEQDIDQAKKGIFEFCPTEQWPKPER